MPNVFGGGSVFSDGGGGSSVSAPVSSGGASQTFTGDAALSAANRNATVVFNSDGLVTYTIPEAEVAQYTVGDTATIANIGAGNVKILTPQSVDLDDTPYTQALIAAGDTATLHYVAANEWRLTGDVSYIPFTPLRFANLLVWLDPNDLETITLQYSTNGLSSATVTGTSGTTALTSSADLSAVLRVGNRIRIGGAGNVSLASMKGADTYEIAAISGVNITTREPLSQTYTTQALYRGRVSQIADKSGNGHHFAPGNINNAPSLLVGAINTAMNALEFDGTGQTLVAPSTIHTFTQANYIIGIGYQADEVGTDSGHLLFATHDAESTHIIHNAGGKELSGRSGSATPIPAPHRPDNDYHVATMRRVFAQCQVGLDNVLNYSENCATSRVATGIYLGGTSATAGTYDGLISEVIITSTAGTERDVEYVKRYLS